MLRFTFCILLILMMICCKDKSKRNVVNTAKIITKSQHVDTRFDSSKVSSTDYNFFSDSVFHGQKEILKFYLTKYKNDTCKSITYEKSEVTNDFDGVLKLGNIRSKKKCSVFVLRPLNYCVFSNEESWDGEAYYFSDTTLPRLQTDSYCCHPNNIFLVGDIDEDGVSEIGQYSSSCASHYKSILVWTLKNNQWRQVGHSVFDQHYMTYDKPFSSYIKKVSKNKFKMLEITDLCEDKTKIGKRNWKLFTM